MPHGSGLAFGVGVLALVAGAGGGAWMWWRRSRAGALGTDAAAVAEGEAHADGMGVAIPSWLTGGKPEESAWDVGRASLAQVQRASKRVPLSSLDELEDRSLFPSGARASAGPAYFHTAYWLAAASRLSGYDAKLVKLAGEHQNAGARWSAIPGGSLRTGNVPDIYRVAYAAIAARAQRDRRLAAIASEIGFKPAEIERAQEKDRASNPLVSAPRTARQIAGKATLPARVLLGLWTGERPDEFSAVGWFAMKWGIRITAAALVLFGLRVYFAPEIAVAQRAAGPLVKRAGQALALREGARAAFGHPVPGDGERAEVRRTVQGLLA